MAQQEENEPMESLDQVHGEHQSKAKEPAFQSQTVSPIHSGADYPCLFRWGGKPRFWLIFGTRGRHWGEFS